MSLDLSRSESLFRRAGALIPGGVNSPVRAFRSVGGTPPFMQRAEGCWLTDVDGNRYVDLVMSYGPLLLGHRPQVVTKALDEALARGTTFGAPTDAEIGIAERITERVPSIDMVRLVNSGTEACMSALRVARAATGKVAFVKFNGCYHGHADAFLVKAGSGALTLGAPDSPGVPAPVVQDTLVADFNDLESVREIFRSRAGDIAAIFVEPVAGNMGCVPPKPGFLEGLRALCDEHGAMLVFDEVMTGFRLGPAGYQSLTEVQPDLTCLGKIIGGGLPVGAYGGRRECMELVAPAGKVYQAGTLSGNPLAVAAGKAMLDASKSGEVYAQLEDSAAHLEAGFENIISSLSLDAHVRRVGSMVSLWFRKEPVHDLADAMSTDLDRFKDFFHRMLEQGVFLPPSPFEAWFLSTAHDTEALDHVLEAARNALT